MPSAEDARFAEVTIHFLKDDSAEGTEGLKTLRAFARTDYVRPRAARSR
jgi:hypothetical protein